METGCTTEQLEIIGYTTEELLKIIEEQKAKIQDLEENLAIVTLEACSLRRQLADERAMVKKRHVVY